MLLDTYKYNLSLSVAATVSLSSGPVLDIVVSISHLNTKTWQNRVEVENTKVSLQVHVYIYLENTYSSFLFQSSEC